MVEEEHKEDCAENLRGKVSAGVKSILESILEDEDVQEAIKRSVRNETFKSGLVMSSIIIGGILILNGLKALAGLGAGVDLIFGAILLLAGGLLALKGRGRRK